MIAAAVVLYLLVGGVVAGFTDADEPLMTIALWPIIPAVIAGRYLRDWTFK